MKKIITITEIEGIANSIRNSKKNIVLTGGCFDILHPGHLSLLQRAKKQGDVLVVLLESDETITKLKGKNRPIFSQQTRAELLLELKSVDFVVLLKPNMHNTDYDRLVNLIKPAIIATTKGDLYLGHKKRQAKLVDAKIVEMPHIQGASTTRIAQLLHDEI